MINSIPFSSVPILSFDILFGKVNEIYELFITYLRKDALPPATIVKHY